VQHAICAMQLWRHYTYTYISDGHTLEEGFSDDVGAAWEAIWRQCGAAWVLYVKLRHQCSGQYGVDVLYHASGSEE